MKKIRVAFLSIFCTVVLSSCEVGTCLNEIEVEDLTSEATGSVESVGSGPTFASFPTPRSGGDPYGD